MLRWITDGTSGVVYVAVDDVRTYAEEAIEAIDGTDSPVAAEGIKNWIRSTFGRMHDLAMTSVIDVREFDRGTPAAIGERGTVAPPEGLPALPTNPLSQAVELGNEMADHLEKCVATIENLRGSLGECLMRARLAQTALALEDVTEARVVLGRLTHYLASAGAVDPTEGD